MRTIPRNTIQLKNGSFRTVPIFSFDACSKGRLLLMEPDKGAFVNPTVMMATEEALRRKAEAKHIVYTAVPVESQRYRFVALNEMGRMLLMR
jgi:hypothetical protein